MSRRSTGYRSASTPCRWRPLPSPLASAWTRPRRGSRAIGATVEHGGTKAYYAAGTDRIQLPPFEAFRDAHGYYATRGHETVHWTSHPTRLARSFGRERWGDEGYAREELVAELGAAFLAADLGLALEPRADHAAYLASWITVLQQRPPRHRAGGFTRRARGPLSPRAATRRATGGRLTAERVAALRGGRLFVPPIHVLEAGPLVAAKVRRALPNDLHRALG